MEGIGVLLLLLLLLGRPLSISGLNRPKNEMVACFQSVALLGNSQKEDLKDAQTSFASQNIRKAWSTSWKAVVGSRIVKSYPAKPLKLVLEIVFFFFFFFEVQQSGRMLLSLCEKEPSHVIG